MKKRIGKEQLLVIGMFVAIMLILLWRCFYSINYGDEPYCISSVWRFYKGDALLAEDWFPAQQLIAWILSPLFYLFRLFSDSNDGIILASRIAYVVFQGIVSTIIYIRLKEYKYYRVPAVLFYLLFTQNNMFTLNYNTLGIGCMLLVLAILTTEQRFSKGILIIVGVLTAVMILSQPYAIIMFVLWAVIVLLLVPFSRKKTLHPLLRFRTLFFVGLGSFLVLIAFGAVVLSRAGIAEIQNGFQYLMSDPEHQMDLKYKVTKYFERFYRYYRNQIVITGVCLIIGFFKDNKIVRFMKIESFLLAIMAAINALISLGWISDYVPIDFICVPMTFLGVSIWLLGKKKNKELFFAWIVPALFYTFCVQLTTNTGILAVTSACIVATVGSVLMLGEVLKEAKETVSKPVYQSILLIMIAVFGLQGLLLTYHRINATWWSASVEECSEMIEKGPAQGIYTSPEDAKEYYAALDVIDSLDLNENDKILFIELEPMLYLYADLPAASYSTWTIEENNFLDDYYQYYPEKEPTVVCWMQANNQEEAIGISYFLEKGYQLIETSEGIVLRQNK